MCAFVRDCVRVFVYVRVCMCIHHTNLFLLKENGSGGPIRWAI